MAQGGTCRCEHAACACASLRGTIKEARLCDFSVCVKVEAKGSARQGEPEEAPRGGRGLTSEHRAPAPGCGNIILLTRQRGASRDTEFKAVWPSLPGPLPALTAGGSRVRDGAQTGSQGRPPLLLPCESRLHGSLKHKAKSVQTWIYHRRILGISSRLRRKLPPCHSCGGVEGLCAPGGAL